jgi:hypothetical protein
MVLGVCRRALTDPANVEDAFQATFLVLVRRADSVRVGDSLGRWVYGVSRRVAAKARARSLRARIRTGPLEVEPRAPDSPADQRGLLAALDDEVGRLPHALLARAMGMPRFPQQEGDILAEIGGALRSAQDPVLRKEALLFKTCLSFLEPIDGRAAVSLAEAFSRQAPGDERIGQLLCAAEAKLDDDWYLRAGIAAILILAGREYRGLFHERLDNGKHRERDQEARIAENKRRRLERLGEPFELEFADAITGRPVSINALRGKLVVVDFWAAYHSLFAAEIPTMKRLYAQYHDDGVAFIGVSLDLPEADGGLDALKNFVAGEQIRPQYYQDLDANRVATGPGATDRILASVLDYEGFDSNRVVPQTAASEFARS